MTNENRTAVQGFFTSHWPIHFRAALYFFLESLPILAAGFYKFAKGDETPKMWFILALLCNAVYHGCVGLRAYFDNSYTRYINEIKNGSGNPAIPGPNPVSDTRGGG